MDGLIRYDDDDDDDKNTINILYLLYLLFIISAKQEGCEILFRFSAYFLILNVSKN